MNFFIFMAKKVLKSRLTLVPVLLVLVTSLMVLFLNDRAGKETGLENQVKENITESIRRLEIDQEKLATLNQTSEEYQPLEKNIIETENLIEQEKNFLKDFQKGNWKKVYLRQIDNIKRQQTAFLNGSSAPALEKSLAQDLKKYQTLAKAPLPYEDVDFPTTGIQYTLSLFKHILPILLILSVIFILTNLYGSAFFEQINKLSLLPESTGKVVVKSLLSGIAFSLFHLLLILVIVFAIATIFFGSGSLDYPILGYQSNGTDFFFTKVGDTILPTLGLFSLSLVFIVVLSFFLTTLLKNKLLALFLTILVAIGGVLLPNVIQPIQTIAHYLPTTYLNSFDIVTGVFQHTIDNSAVSIQSGILSLLVSIMLLTAGSLFLQQDKRRN